LPVRKLLVLTVLLGLATGCSKGTVQNPAKASPAASSPAGLPLADLSIRNGGSIKAKFTVEVADTPQTQATGLMNVSKLPPSRGMVFLFSEPTSGAFYMKNTLIPLDIAFWDASMKIIDTKQMQPCRAEPCPLYRPAGSYVGALEVNEGALAARKVASGDTIVLERRD
jgi:uncharacterized membrane protein (UPF0127 family)